MRDIISGRFARRRSETANSTQLSGCHIPFRTTASGSMVGTFRMIVTVVLPKRRVTIEKTVTLSGRDAPSFALYMDNRGDYIIFP